MAKTISTTLALLMLATSVARADTLLLASIDLDKQSVDSRPKPGMSMTAVESSYGAPVERHPAVGGANAQQPPITRWDYAAFSVYFENDRVIHAVAHHQ
jgi:hypothetical protein